MEDQEPSRLWLIPFAIGTACLLGIQAVWNRRLGEALVALGSISYIVAACVYIVPRLQRRRNQDPYDLRALRDLHDHEELEAIEAAMPSYLETVVCPGCGNTCNSKFGRCPNCCHPLK